MWEEHGGELGWHSGKEDWMCVGNLLGFSSARRDVKLLVFPQNVKL